MHVSVVNKINKYLQLIHHANVLYLINLIVIKQHPDVYGLQVVQVVLVVIKLVHN